MGLAWAPAPLEADGRRGKMGFMVCECEVSIPERKIAMHRRSDDYGTSKESTFGTYDPYSEINQKKYRSEVSPAISALSTKTYLRYLEGR